MHFALVSALLLALQVNHLSAACNTISSQVPPIESNGSGSSSTAATREAVSSASSAFKSSTPTGSENQNKSQLTRTNETKDRDIERAGGNEHLSMNEIDKFRLEYNKYKILSHLRITGDLDEIAHDIDSDVRRQLVETAALNNRNNSIPNTRYKRSLSCAEIKRDKNPCCLENFFVNFTLIGWDKWILYPTGYSANYCRGQCDLSHARYYHSTLLSKYSNVISLCCSPRKMAPLKLLYIDEENKVHQRIVPDMIVESCDCA